MSQMLQQGGPPPGLLALLAAHANGTAAPPPAAPDTGGGQESPQVARQEVQLIQQMIDLGNKYQSIQPDAEHKATMAKVLTTLHQYLASEQKDAEAALGGGAPTRLLRKLGG